MSPLPVIGQEIRVSGIVQGVGFRPTVWRLARDAGIVGEVWNDADGVAINAWGDAETLSRFTERLRDDAPGLAQIEAITTTLLDASRIPPDSFQIGDSRHGGAHTAVAADAATCPDCVAEILEASNRRYRYPFTNCTHCGPRLSIVRAIPYDRANTSMASFDMCPACQAEYDDPSDRRFHAQPNACPECGPQLWLESGDECITPDGELIQYAAGLIEQGKIIAIKGIGGFHLACDAGNSEVVNTLRQRKRRYQKPFALMARDIEMVETYAQLGEPESELLQHSAAPIVVLYRSTGSLPQALAPGQNTLGFMLPYTPLHHLLMQALPRPIVLTSANRSDEPQLIDNQSARELLGAIADYFLMHDRDIVNRLDDSLVRVSDDKPGVLRRARGFAPQPLKMPKGFESANNILGMGGELKSSFCLLKDGDAIVSQHLGDLENAEAYQSYRQNLQRYRELYDFSPSRIAVDAHPDYLSSQLGHAIAEEEGLPLVKVQHHHAHIAACMAEHGLALDSDRVLGVALDGLGYGDNGELWGGEFLLADYRGYERLAHFQPVAMPGGARAIYEPWRNTYAHLSFHLGWERVAENYADLEIVRFLHSKPLPNLQLMMDRGLNSPLASSAGRLFDAVAAALGLCRDGVGYEGQAAIELEALAVPYFADCKQEYGYELLDRRLSWKPLWGELLKNLTEGVEPGVISTRFHRGVARAVADTAVRNCSQCSVDTVVLVGGVFQNHLLLEQCSKLLRQQGLLVLSPSNIPCNDGGLSLGQAVIANACV